MFYGVYKYFQQRNRRARGNPAFLKGEFRHFLLVLSMSVFMIIVFQVNIAKFTRGTLSYCTATLIPVLVYLIHCPRENDELCDQKQRRYNSKD